MISNLPNKKDCCGCFLCEYVCKQNAIIMKSDVEGFMYPEVDAKKCVDCKNCVKFCPQSNVIDSNNENVYNNFKQTFYAAKHTDELIRVKSSSGGVFSAISEEIISNGGIVYGVVLNEELTVTHDRASSFSSIEKMRGSKYIQSNLKGFYNLIEQDLKTGRKVVFFGTPCQCDALNTFGLTKIENLITIDLICHGVMSPLLWENYLSYVENKRKRKIVSFNFRSKKHGWHNSVEEIGYYDGKKESDTFISQLRSNLYYSNLCMRPVCHNCKYKNYNRVSDITIGDCWGIERTKPELDDNRGLSLVIINTEKGAEIISNFNLKMLKIMINKADCIQRPLIECDKPAEDRDAFWEDYENYGFKYVTKKYLHNNAVGKIKYRIKKIIEKKY